MDNDYDDEGNNIVPCPICLDKRCPSKDDMKCPKEDEFVRYHNKRREQEIDSFIREKCIEANKDLIKIDIVPCSNCRGEFQFEISQNHITGEIEYGYCSHCNNGYTESYVLTRPIQLSDILMAIEKVTNKYNIDTSGVFTNLIHPREDTVRWNLSLPYEQQDIEVKKFIYEILK